MRDRERMETLWFFWVLRVRDSGWRGEGTRQRGQHALRLQLLMTTFFCVLYPTLFRADTAAPMVAPGIGRLRAARENRTRK